MHESHISLRLTEKLARALAKESTARGIAKSLLVREAVSTYLAGPARPSASARSVSAAELARLWSSLPALSAAEGRDLAADIERARRELSTPTDRWK